MLKVFISRFCKNQVRSFVRHHSIKHILRNDTIINDKLHVKGWVKTMRSLKHVTFLSLNDGSCLNNLQIVIPENIVQYPMAASYGASVAVTGSLRPSPGKEQAFDLVAEKVEVIGSCDQMLYPFKVKKQHPQDYLRQYLHLRPRAQAFSSLLRVRNSFNQAVHHVLQEEGFIQVHTPILTSNDCEGAGEVFQVEPADATLKAKMEAEEGTGIKDHFFNTAAYLTVSGQLHLEAMAGAFTKVYTFGPTFRAENSQGRHHLSEFYMLEAELSFVSELQDLLQVIENLIQKSIHLVCDRSSDDIHWHWQNSEKNNGKEIVDKITSQSFIRMTYTEAIDTLERHSDQFTFKPMWGKDLQKEHERYLVIHCGGVPVFVVDFPADIKPFYMKLNPDEKTVAAVDLLLPDVGEACGGSLRETDLDTLEKRLEEQGQKTNLDWYLDLHRFGSTPHGGFGIGFERLLQAILGISNIRDTIPFPRSPNSCKL